MGTSISFKRPDGKDANGYLANAARGNAPGVVVIQEWWGLQEQIKALCDRFAVAGFDALAPDLYKGKVVPYHDTDAAGKEMNSLDFMDATTQTVRGAAQYLGRNGAKVGLTGFCLGGAVTIIGATKIPELTAAVVFYGIPPEAAAKPADVKIPLQAHFASRDDWCTPQVVGRLREGHEGSRQIARTVPLRCRPRFRQRAAHVGARSQGGGTRLGPRHGVFQEASRVRCLYSVIRKSGNRFFLATNAGRVCAEIMLKQRDEIMIRFNLIGS